MSAIRTFFPLRTTVFFRPENTEIASDNLWKPLSRENQKQLGRLDETRKCIGQLDSHTRIMSYKTYENCVSCYCSTDSADHSAVFVSYKILLEQVLTKAQGEQLVQLSSTLGIEVLVVPSNLYSKRALKKNKRVLYLMGPEDQVNAAETQVHALLSLFKNKVLKYVAMDSPALFPVCAGIELNNLEYYRKLYNTKITMPRVWNKSCGTIFLSGDVHSSVLATKDHIEQLIEDAKGSMYYSTLQNMAPLKLLFLSKFRQHQLNAIMEKYQCFIQIEKNYVQFSGTCLTALGLAIKHFTLEALMPIFETHVCFPDAKEQHSLGEHLYQIASGNNVIVMQLGNSAASFVLVGLPQDLCQASASLEELEIPGHVRIKYFIELSSEYKDFISGKKSGKITRIMENAKCSINLSFQENNINMGISLTSESSQGSKMGIMLLNDELPAEDSFFIPDAYHRPVIGTRGSVIQTIMKRYNVFIQFSNTYQPHHNNNGLIRLDNVIIRCPYKNRKMIPLAKSELKRIVAEYSELQPKTFIKMSLGQYRYYFQETKRRENELINDVEKKTGTYIMFPEQMPDHNQHLEIRGNDQNSVDAAKELLTHLSSERQITLDGLPLDKIDFSNRVVMSLRRAMSVGATLEGKLLTLNFRALDDEQIAKALKIVKAYIFSKGVHIKSDHALDFSTIIERSTGHRKSPYAEFV
ncbi:LAME_0H16732g1_1 [Lachancea meyersii CBS 8951]|uniref:LAME_0H16732g1_1 n=1 Tax=Lachancea meyersii CBS 8951 TaxID=1266667 RepID=A0A1G4KIK4_9SACH|nr:LAME_0H16732g1_1 [Lachancea meyersii CBS 8951]